MDIDFEWDEQKRQVNLRNHKVDFADAFERVLVVVYTQPDEQTIRIISARRATAAERRHYEQG
jgi:uncharacterized DUF497 family protein